MDMEADWLEVASAQCVNFDVIACVPLVVLKELDHIKGRTHQVCGCYIAQGSQQVVLMKVISIVAQETKHNSQYAPHDGGLGNT